METDVAVSHPRSNPRIGRANEEIGERRERQGREWQTPFPPAPPSLPHSRARIPYIPYVRARMCRWEGEGERGEEETVARMAGRFMLGSRQLFSRDARGDDTRAGKLEKRKEGRSKGKRRNPSDFCSARVNYVRLIESAIDDLCPTGIAGIPFPADLGVLLPDLPSLSPSLCLACQPSILASRSLHISLPPLC